MNWHRTMLTIGFLVLFSLGIISGQAKTSEASENQGVNDKVLSYVIDIRTVPKGGSRRGRKSYSKPSVQRKYVVKNRARNYDAIARMSLGHDEDDDGYIWTSVENDTREHSKAHFVFEPFSTDPSKHAAIFQWIDQMLNGDKVTTPKPPKTTLVDLPTQSPLEKSTQRTTLRSTGRPTRRSKQRSTKKPTHRTTFKAIQREVPKVPIIQKQLETGTKLPAASRRRSGPLAKLKQRKTRPLLQGIRRRGSTIRPHTLVDNGIPFRETVSVQTTKSTLLEHKAKSKPIARLVRKAKRPLKSPLVPKVDASHRYHYELDNGVYRQKELSDGVETQGQFEVQRSGFSSKTVYSVIDGSGFQSESTYSISQDLL